jgi:hypothetical protein
MTLHYAAGILPVTWRDGERCFLVGRDARDAVWSDFGGKVEKADRGCPLSTAAREFYEETYGCVVGARALRQRLNGHNCLLLRSKTQNGHPYYMFVVEVPYMPHLRNTFLKVLNFMRFKNVQKYVEKTDVRYVSWTTLQAAQFPKRTVFDHTVQAHRDVLRRVAAGEPWRALCAELVDEFTSLGGGSRTAL